MRLRLPYRPRWVHRLIALMRGLFWRPCPICGELFGEHEWFDSDQHRDEVRCRFPGPRAEYWHPICPRCTAMGLGGHRAPLSYCHKRCRYLSPGVIARSRPIQKSER